MYISVFSSQASNATNSERIRLALLRQQTAWCSGCEPSFCTHATIEACCSARRRTTSSWPADAAWWIAKIPPGAKISMNR